MQNKRHKGHAFIPVKRIQASKSNFLMDKIAASNTFWLVAGLFLSTLLLFPQSWLTHSALERIETQKVALELRKMQHQEKTTFLASLCGELEAMIARVCIADEKNLWPEFIKEISNAKSLAMKAEIYFPETNLHHSAQMIFLYAMINTNIGSHLIAMGKYSPEDRAVIDSIRAAPIDKQDELLANQLISLKKKVIELSKQMQSESLAP